MRRLLPVPGMPHGTLLAWALALILLRCAPGAVPAAAPPAPAPTASSAAATRGTDWEPAWNALVQAARREGKVVVKGPPTGAVRTALPAAFKERFGVDVEYIGGPS